MLLVFLTNGICISYISPMSTASYVQPCNFVNLVLSISMLKVTSLTACTGKNITMDKMSQRTMKAIFTLKTRFLGDLD